MVDFPFDENIANNSDLLMSVGTHSFSYAIVNNEGSRLKAMFNIQTPTNHASDFDRLLQTEPLLNLSYRQVKIKLQTQNFTFIPNELYDEEQLTYYARIIDPKVGDTLIVSSIKAVGCRNVFAIKSDQYNWFNKHFTDVKFFSQADSLLQAILIQYSLSNTSGVFIHVLSDQCIEIVILLNGQLHFYNIFLVENIEEMQYFVLATCRQMNVNPENMTLNFLGSIEPHHSFCQSLLPYFEQTQIISTVNFLDIPLTFATVPMQNFFSVLGLHLCA